MINRIPKPILDLLLNCYPRWSPTMFKATLVGVFALAIMLPLALVAVPFIEFFNGMAAQPKGKAQMTYGRLYGAAPLVTQDSTTGTLPRNYYPYRFDYLGNEIKDARAVGELLENPIPITKESLRRGQNRYNIFCIACHGPKGHGDGGAVGANRFPTPPSLHTDQARNYKDGTFYHHIVKGTGQMPSYADKLSPEDRWKTIHYVRALQRAMNPKPEDLAK